MSVVIRRNFILIALLLAAPAVTAAQAQTRERRLSKPEAPGRPTAVRSRVVGDARVANHAEKPKSDDSKAQTGADLTADFKPINQKTTQPQWGNTAVIARSATGQRVVPAGDSTLAQSKSFEQDTAGARKLVQRTAMTTPSAAAVSTSGQGSANSSRALTRGVTPTVLYQVGIGDVLDIRLTNLPTRESTLFTVLKNGVLEYPLLSGPLVVAGLTTDEIGRLLTTEIKVIKTDRVSVSVRDYASHAIVISGLIDSPGRKALRREAMPLFAVLAEALLRPEATAATIVRQGKEQTISLKNEKAMATLVLPGDVIKVSGSGATAKGFIYVGGDVSAPGEKEFREGMTLTQALLSAGGALRAGAATVKVARRNSDGFLTSKEYNLRAIQEGKVQDPFLESGDRIELARGL